ncbi:MAG: TIGR02253 family HAD-type hydrolase [Candidatus Micrarchaeia archaeon]
MRYKAILFDVDNTLIDFMKMKQEAVKSAVAAMIEAGLPMKQKEAEREVWSIYEEYGYEYQKVFQKLLIRHMRKVDYSILAPGVVAYKRKKEGYLVPYDGVRETLYCLKKRGYKLGVLSDAPRIQVWLRLAAMGLHKTFDVVVTYDDTKKRKPDPAPFRKVIEKLKTRPAQIIMVGDNVERDINGAKRLGIRTVLAKYGADLTSCRRSAKKADFEIVKFEELIEAVDYFESHAV